MSRSPGHQVRRRLRRGAYLLPSLFTMGNILLGFYAVVRGLRGDFETAAILVFCAGVLDGLDGRIARMTQTESDFGREFDSLADVLTFGAAPALLSYLWGLNEFGRIGWLVPLFFLVCTATRLARYNVQTSSADSRYFVGLPTPAAAGSICSVLFFAPDSASQSWYGGLLMAILILLALLMISTFRFASLKKVDLNKRWSYRAALPLAAFLLILAYNPPAFFLIFAVVYVGSGPIGWIWRRLRRSSADKAAELDTREAAP
nr:CDP-diacylglycerol--serine O-phosphatidyltransferase-like [Nerophis lumbriciformis]